MNKTISLFPGADISNISRPSSRHRRTDPALLRIRRCSSFFVPFRRVWGRHRHSRGERDHRRQERHRHHLDGRR